MNPLFKNVTTYTGQNYKQFMKFHNNKYNFSHNAITLIFTIMLLYCTIMNIMSKNILYSFILILILILFLLYRLFLPAYRYKKTTSEYKKNKSVNFVFSFYNNYFTIGKKRYYYFKLFKVFETDEYFYLYLNPDRAALVSKNGFKIGSSTEFANFIKKKCLFKYTKNNT